MFKKLFVKCKSLLILGRYNNPVGAILLMWPCYWGALASMDNEKIIHALIYFSLGSLVMRGAGCCINDIFDKKFDKEVERTKSRPLASGLLSTGEALWFIVFQFMIGLLVVVQFNLHVILVSFLIIPLVILYPIFKRITFFPQVILGLVFNWGIILGHLSQENNFNYDIFYLYFAGVLLTVAYDTIYGFQDIKDDKKLGLKSLAIYLEKKVHHVFTIYLLSFLMFLIFFMKNFSNIWFSIICGSIILICFTFQYISFKKGKKLISIFKSNMIYGGIISFLIFFQIIYAVK